MTDTVTQKVIELCEANHYTYGYRKITALINQCYTSPIWLASHNSMTFCVTVSFL
jgi:alpha-D-ribose 1-methylphosphonate 5-triphosphate diphosphatase PhnM